MGSGLGSGSKSGSGSGSGGQTQWRHAPCTCSARSARPSAAACRACRPSRASTRVRTASRSRRRGCRSGTPARAGRVVAAAAGATVAATAATRTQRRPGTCTWWRKGAKPHVPTVLPRPLSAPLECGWQPKAKAWQPVTAGGGPPSHCGGPFNVHLHQTVQSLSLHHGEQPGLVLSPCSLFSERHSPGGTGGGGGSGGGGGGAGRQKAHDEHLHQVQCTAACLGWHMAVHRRLGVSPVWAEGQVAGRSNICAGRHAALDGQEAQGGYPGGEAVRGTRSLSM